MSGHAHQLDSQSASPRQSERYCSDTAERARLGCLRLRTIVTPSRAVSILFYMGRTPLRARIPAPLAIKRRAQ